MQGSGTVGNNSGHNAGGTQSLPYNGAGADQQFAEIASEFQSAIDHFSDTARALEDAKLMAQQAADGAQGNKAQLKPEIFDLLVSGANENATPRAIQDQRELLLAYGPADGLFAEAVNAAEIYFNIGQVMEAAGRVAQVYADLGPVEAARLLARYTSESDPLIGARILDAAEATISQIITHIGVGEYHDWPGAPDEEPRSFKSDMETKEQIFGFLSAAVERPSQSTEAAEPIGAMAQRINEELYRYVVGSMIDGNGLTLPFNMLNLLPEDLVLRMLVYGGVSGLTTRLSGENHILTRLARFDPEAARLLNSAMNARLTERLNVQDHPAVSR